MEIEELTDEMTEKIVGGVRREVETFTRKLIEVKEVECMGCGGSFKLTINYFLPRHRKLDDFLVTMKRRCTCPYPNCRFVNFQYMLYDFQIGVINHKK